MHISKDHISLGHTIAGNAIDIIRYTIEAKEKGKNIYIQSGIHGGEVTYWLQHQLFNFLKEHIKSGKVTFVPFASPASWEQRSYFYTYGKFDLYDGKDFNSHFPGQESGSLHQRTAFQLSKLARGSDLALDLHTSRKSIPFCIYTKADYAPLVKELGLKYNYFDAEISPDTSGSFDCAMDPANTQNLCIECGGHDEYDSAKIKEVFSGLLRLLALHGIIDTKHAKPAGKSFFFANHKKIVAQKSGFVRYDTALGNTFKKGDILFTLYGTSDLGSEKQEIAAEDGILYKHAPTHIYRIGDDTLHYIPLSELKPL